MLRKNPSSFREIDRAVILIFPALPSASLVTKVLISPSTILIAPSTSITTLPALPVPSVEVSIRVISLSIKLSVLVMESEPA